MLDAFVRVKSFEPNVTNLATRLYDGYAAEVARVDQNHDGVITFIEGDCEAIDSALPAQMLRSLPHPWLVIEDAHVNVSGVLRYLHSFLARGDYLVVEDSDGKQDELHHFLDRRAGCYLVDTHYTDFFGRNATSAQDSILVRTGTDS